MSRKVWLVISIVLNLIGGLQNALIPAIAAQSMGVKVDSGGLELLRFVGVLQLSYCVLSWVGMKVTSADGQRAVDLTLFAGYALGVPLIIRWVLIDLGGVALYIQGGVAFILALGFGSLYFGNRTKAAQQAGNSRRASGQ